MDIVAIGELIIDFSATNLDEDGYPTMAAHPGGAPANYLVAAQKYGLKTGMIGKVGNDVFGELLCKTLEKEGVNTQGIIHDDTVFTTLAFVSIDKQGERSFSFARKPGADTCLKIEEVDFSLIDSSKIFHFGTLSLTDMPAKDATVKAVQYAKQNKKLVSFDPNLRIPLWDDLKHARASFQV